MPLPNFLIIGAQKSGTTWLMQRLRQHPDVYMPTEEIHYFDKEYNYKKGVSWYRRFFQEVQDEAAIGEKTPDYYWTNREGAEGHLPHVHQNIHDLLPEARLLLVLRNPVDRAVSAVNHLVRTGRVSPRYSIDELLVGDQKHLVEDHGVIDYGRYYQHIQTYLTCFDPSQLLILIFEEDIVEAPHEGLSKVTSFLEVDPSFPFTGVNTRNNPSSLSKAGLYLQYYLPVFRPLIRGIDKYVTRSTDKRRPTERTLRRLHEIYREENEKLFRFLGRRISSWSLDTECA